MRGKHRNLVIHALASVQRERLRAKIASAVTWLPLSAPEPGCTAIIGVCSRLPAALPATLRCLHGARWPELKRVLLVADCTREAFPAELAAQLTAEYPGLPLEFLFYTPQQAALTKSLELPFVYCWLSWCIGLAQVRTQHVLLHDYDALILGPTLEPRYRAFAASGTKAQGISWYKSNGVEESDHLATTFEAFYDTTWLRSYKPVQLFNKLRLLAGRSIDMDITLDIQHRDLADAERAIVPMDLSQLVHPSQMVHQYTMFRHSSGAPLPCFSIPMIPFFALLGGSPAMLEQAIAHLETGNREDLDLLSDGTRINLTQLDIPQVDWALKQMVQALAALGIPPDPRLYRYGLGLYRIIGAPNEAEWRGDFTPDQRAWIAAAENASSPQLA
jgi:hypothetical protein